VARDEGTISIDDRDISILPMHSRSRLGIGYLPQEASIFRKLSVEDNIMAVLQTRDEMTNAQRQDKLEDLLEEFHIQHI
ncbi:ATP-binding cassette domain-containing protein, partial [Vibrio splendidus]